MDIEHLILVVQVGFPVKEFSRCLFMLQSHVDAQLGTHVVETIVTLCSVADERPHLALVVLGQLAHHDGCIGLVVAIVGHCLASVGRHNTVDAAHRLRTGTKCKETRQQENGDSLGC